jgi:predicted RNase H-like nuclease (RuvC/YqgF family)
MTDENDDNDLYEDLADTKVASKVAKVGGGRPARASASTSILEAAARPPSFSEHLDNLQRRVDALEGENQQLKRNMGTLFRTAKKEIKRKDDQIARLMQELDKKR